MGSLFGPGSDSTATDNRQTGGDAAVIQRGTGNKTIQTGATLLDLQNAKFDSSIKGNKGNVTINDLGAVASLAGQFTDAIQNISAASSGALSNALQAQSGQVSDALGKVADLSQSSQTGGDSTRNRIILIIVLGVLALVGSIFYFKR